MNFAASETNDVNRFFIVIYVKSTVNPKFIEACKMFTQSVQIVPDFKLFDLTKAVNSMCANLINKAYIDLQLKKSDYFMCVMNKVNLSISGFVFGTVHIDNDFTIQTNTTTTTYSWVSIYVDVLCGHNFIKKNGFFLISAIKAITLNLFVSMQVNKNGFMLESVPEIETQNFYDSNDILPIVKTAKPFDDMHFRGWRIPSNVNYFKATLKTFDTANIRLKPTNNFSLITPTQKGISSPDLPTEAVFPPLQLLKQVIVTNSFKQLSKQLTKKEKQHNKLNQKYQTQREELKKQFNKLNDYYGNTSRYYNSFENFMDSKDNLLKNKLSKIAHKITTQNITKNKKKSLFKKNLTLRNIQKKKLYKIPNVTNKINRQIFTRQLNKTNRMRKRTFGRLLNLTHKNNKSSSSSYSSPNDLKSF